MTYELTTTGKVQNDGEGVHWFQFPEFKAHFILFREEKQQQAQVDEETEVWKIGNFKPQKVPVNHFMSGIN